MSEGKAIPFEDWWASQGRFYDPDTEDVPWFDKRKFLAEYAYNAGISTQKFAPFYAAQPQPARTDEKTAWAAILRWAYENSPDAVVSINRLATEVVEARAICAELAALRQSLDECVVALENAKIGLEACGMGCPYIDNALTAAKHLIAPLDKQG